MGTRMSGIDLDGRVIRKGAADTIARFVTDHAGTVSPELRGIVDTIARSGGTPLVVADGNRALGVIHLKDIVKGGIREKFAELNNAYPTSGTGPAPSTAFWMWVRDTR